MVSYTHTQSGTVIRWSISGGIAVGASVLASLVASGEAPGFAIAACSGVLALLVACLFAFGSLTVAVKEGEVSAAFGPGLFRHRIRTSAIRGVHAVRNGWYLGWGIRWVPHGWMYNVSGLDAVELDLDGGRKFRIGTDEPAELLAAIQAALATRR